MAWALNPIIGALRRGRFGHSDTQGKSHTNTEAGTGVMCPQAKGCRHHQTLRERQEADSPPESFSLRENGPADMLTLVL